jgi:photosystem II stability/assembly factor-like uncharacterized protein
VLASCSSIATQPASTDHPAGEHSYPAGHIHGMSVDPATNRVLLATHDGLYDVSASPARKIGPNIDLMGFTTAGNGTFYASGHPGPGSRLPNPVGLIRSTDQGRTWEPLSRQGESDFHALAATESRLVGYDGELLASKDGMAWEAVEQGFAPYNLAGTPRGSIVLATTEEGLLRSSDHGATWSDVPDAPLLMHTALSDERAAGVTPDGRVYTSDDSGETWKEQGTVPGQPAAIATQALDSTQRIWVATGEGVQVSNDSGRTFTKMKSSRG